MTRSIDNHPRPAHDPAPGIMVCSSCLSNPVVPLSNYLLLLPPAPPAPLSTVACRSSWCTSYFCSCWVCRSCCWRCSWASTQLFPLAGQWNTVNTGLWWNTFPPDCISNRSCSIHAWFLHDFLFVSKKFEHWENPPRAPRPTLTHESDQHVLLPIIMNAWYIEIRSLAHQDLMPLKIKLLT